MISAVCVLVLALVVIVLSVRLVQLRKWLRCGNVTSLSLVRELGEATDTIRRQRVTMQRLRAELESHDAGGVR